ncbi:hypothetical protein [Labrenzia sp. DG1229]|uniref:hypothetical protein n=1 Tax=Labrenzia sp. DG1229 TaxID=681847 RepID=UPI00048DD121|nr:hypothetical protein [Labrenzia sp. DG1229]
MIEQLITFVTGTAPFACMVVAAACVAVMFRNLRKGGTGPAQTSFGQWPESDTTSSPAPGPIGQAATSVAHRVSLGLAAGIVVGEVLFFLFPGGPLS